MGDGAGVFRRQRLGQEIVKHLGAGLRLVTDRHRDLGADRAGLGLAVADAAEIASEVRTSPA